MEGRKFILTWRGGNRDHEGGASRARPAHCTTCELTLAISPNRGNSGALFLIVGSSVRAVPSDNRNRIDDIFLGKPILRRFI